MTEARFTPSLDGPWTIEVDAGVHQINDSKTGNWVCECMAAAAPLVAAAPDLLAALRNTLTLLKLFTRETDDVAKAAWDEAEAAIAKATGEPAKGLVGGAG